MDKNAIVRRIVTLHYPAHHPDKPSLAFLNVTARETTTQFVIESKDDIGAVRRNPVSPITRNPPLFGAPLPARFSKKTGRIIGRDSGWRVFSWMPVATIESQP